MLIRTQSIPSQAVTSYSLMGETGLWGQSYPLNQRGLKNQNLWHMYMIIVFDVEVQNLALITMDRNFLWTAEF